jgi:hypothetical protein
VLAVGRADDLQARVRSYFSPDQPRPVGRLLRQLHAIHHRVCPGPLTAAIVEGRLIRAWSPPFNRPGTARVRPSGSTPAAAGTARSRPRRGRRRTWTAEQLSCDPVELLTPLADQIRGLALQQRYEEAAALRDEAEALRERLDLDRRVSSLRKSGRMVLAVEGEGELVLDRGIWSGGAAGVGVGVGVGGPVPEPEDQLDLERTIVARWLTDHAGSVRIVEVESPAGLSTPAGRIPELAELISLCAQDPVAATVGSAA